MAGTSEDFTVRMKKNMHSWFGHVERIGDERMPKMFMMGNEQAKKVGVDLG